MTHLELGQSEVPSETDARTVREREEVTMALDLLRRLWNAVRDEPPLGLELLRVRAPELGGAVHRVGGHKHDRAFRNGDGGDCLPVCGAHRRGEGEDVVLSCLGSIVSR